MAIFGFILEAGLLYRTCEKIRVNYVLFSIVKHITPLNSMSTEGLEDNGAVRSSFPNDK